MEQDTELIIKPPHLQSTNIRQGSQAQYQKGCLFNNWCWERSINMPSLCMQKQWNWNPILHHSQKLTRNGQTLKHKSWYRKPPRRKCREEASWHWSWRCIFWIWHEKHNQQKQKSTNRTVSAKQKKLLTTWKDNPQDGRNFLRTINVDQGITSKTCKELT